MKWINLAAGLSLSLLFACQSGAKEEVYVFKDTNGLSPKANAPVTVPASAVQPGLTMQNGTQTIQPNGQQNTPPAAMDAATMQKIMESMKANPTVTTTAVPNGKTPAGMNPPHGQPGHRCDIAVGAPLNSKPQTMPTITQNAQQPTTVVTQQPATPTAPGMNPPHGQPGHRCDIAVGAPLNSKPAVTPVVTATPQVSMTADKAIQSAKKDSGQ